MLGFVDGKLVDDFQNVVMVEDDNKNPGLNELLIATVVVLL